MSGCLGFRCNKSLSFYHQEEYAVIFVSLKTSYTHLCPDGVQTANIGQYDTHYCLSALYIHTSKALSICFTYYPKDRIETAFVNSNTECQLLPRDAQNTLGFGHPFTSPNRGVYVTAGVCLLMS